MKTHHISIGWFQAINMTIYQHTWGHAVFSSTNWTQKIFVGYCNLSRCVVCTFMKASLVGMAQFLWQSIMGKFGSFQYLSSAWPWWLKKISYVQVSIPTRAKSALMSLVLYHHLPPYPHWMWIFWLCKLTSRCLFSLARDNRDCSFTVEP